MVPLLEKHPLIRAVKALTVAIWCLCALIAALLALAILSQVQMRAWQSAVPLARAKGTPPSPMPQPASEADVNGFSALRIDQKMQRASVIAITRFNREGNSLKAMITEIPKQRPGTTFYYSVGQELTEVSTHQEAGNEYGDGEVVFFLGSPAQMVESYSYSHDRIGGLGEMPLATFRQLTAQNH